MAVSKANESYKNMIHIVEQLCMKPEEPEQIIGKFEAEEIEASNIITSMISKYGLT